MNKLGLISSALVVAIGWQAAQAQPPGGGGGFQPPTFDSINQADADGNKDDHLTVEEVTAYFETMMAGRGGGGGRGFDPATIFAGWDTIPEGGDGKITQEEFDARPQGRGRGGPPPQ